MIKSSFFSRRLPNFSSNGASTGEGSKSTKVKSGIKKKVNLEVKAMLERAPFPVFVTQKENF